MWSQDKELEQVSLHTSFLNHKPRALTIPTKIGWTSCNKAVAKCNKSIKVIYQLAEYSLIRFEALWQKDKRLLFFDQVQRRMKRIRERGKEGFEDTEDEEEDLGKESNDQEEGEREDLEETDGDREEAGEQQTGEGRVNFA